MKKEGAPSKDGGAGELKKKVQNVYKLIDPRTIQKGFIRAYSRNQKGDQDESLIPEAFKDWYLDEDSDLSDFDAYIEDDEIHTQSDTDTESETS